MVSTALLSESARQCKPVCVLGSALATVIRRTLSPCGSQGLGRRRCRSSWAGAGRLAVHRLTRMDSQIEYKFPDWAETSAKNWELACSRGLSLSLTPRVFIHPIPGYPGEGAASAVSSGKLPSLSRLHRRHAAALPWFCEGMRPPKSSALCALWARPAREPGDGTALSHLAEPPAAQEPGQPDLVSEPSLSPKNASFVDLTGTLQTTLFLTGFCTGYEPGEHVVKRELGHVFTWVYFIIFLSWCSTLFYLIQKCLWQLDGHFSACEKSKEIKNLWGA